MDNRVVVISGGSRGLGQAIAERLLLDGAMVATFSRSDSEFVQGRTGEDRFYWEAIDAGDSAALKGFIRRVEERYGGVDVLINNAGYTVDKLLPMMSPSDIHTVLQVNLEAVIALSHFASRAMLRRSGGVILNVGSILGGVGVAGASVYSAAKAGVEGMTRSLARELGPKNIRVNVVAPGYLETDMTSGMSAEQKARIARRTPLGRMGRVSDVVHLVRFLISPEAEFITGQTFVVDGGFTC